MRGRGRGVPMGVGKKKATPSARTGSPEMGNTGGAILLPHKNYNLRMKFSG